ncbi:MAG: hypothetical protein KDB62_09730 [Solirubrobacterales bacterium]|nr:hypothetical protein [Solirubrobacterales bacterium]
MSENTASVPSGGDHMVPAMKKPELRLLTMISLLAACVVALSACGSDDNDETAAATTSTETATATTGEATEDVAPADDVSVCDDINSEDYEVSVRNISCEEALALIPGGDETPLTDAGWTCGTIETDSDHIVRRCTLEDMAIRYSAAQEAEAQETTSAQGSEGPENDGPDQAPNYQGSEGPENEGPDQAPGIQGSEGPEVEAP